MHGTRAARTLRAALFALIGVLVISAGAGSAYAGGREHGNGSGHQKWVSDESQKTLPNGAEESDDDDYSSDDADSDGRGKDCKKKESSTGEKTGEQPSVTPPVGPTGEQGKKVEDTEEAEHGKKEKEEEHGKKEKEESKGGPGHGGKAPTGPAPTPGAQPTPAVVTTPAPAPAPVQAQQAPTPAGEVQAEAEQAPEEAAQGGEARPGGRVLAEAEAAPAAEEGGLAETGFDAWQVALLGAVCVAGAALLLRRARRS